MQKLKWASVMIFGSGFIAPSDACVQVNLLSVENYNGVITDYNTPEDEIEAWLGVDEYFVYAYKNTWRANQQRSIERGRISMPCYHDSVFYIDMTEHDDLINERSQIVLACRNFQLGKNQIIMSLRENAAAISSIGEVISSMVGTSFNFGGQQDSSAAIYVFTFDVEQECSMRSDFKKYMVDKDRYDGGSIHFYSMSKKSTVFNKINSENSNIKPQEEHENTVQDTQGGSTGDGSSESTGSGSSTTGGQNAGSGTSSTGGNAASGGGQTGNSGTTSGGSSGSSSTNTSGSGTNGSTSNNSGGSGSSSTSGGGSGSSSTSGGGSGSSSTTGGGSNSSTSDGGSSGDSNVDLNLNNFKTDVNTDGGSGGSGGTGGSGGSDGTSGLTKDQTAANAETQSDMNAEDGGQDPESWTIDGFHVNPGTSGGGGGGSSGGGGGGSSGGSSGSKDGTNSSSGGGSSGTNGGTNSDGTNSGSNSSGGSNGSTTGGNSSGNSSSGGGANSNTQNTDGSPEFIQDDASTEQVQLQTGDTVSLANDVGTDAFDIYKDFKSTQFIERDLVTGFNNEPEEQKNWWQIDSGAGMPNWTLVVLICLFAVILVVAIFIICIMRRNKAHRNQQDRAIMLELQQAIQDGYDLPADLEARLARFQLENEEFKENDKKDSKRMAKVHPNLCADDSCQAITKGGRGNLTRYAVSPSPNSSCKSMMNSQSTQKTMLEDSPQCNTRGKLTRNMIVKQSLEDTVAGGRTILPQDGDDSGYSTNQQSKIKLDNPVLQDCHVENIDQPDFPTDEDKPDLKSP